MRREYLERTPAGCRFSIGGGSEGAGRTPASGDQVLSRALRKPIAFRWSAFSFVGEKEDLKRRCGANTWSANRQDADLASEAGRREPTGRRRLETKSSLGQFYLIILKAIMAFLN
jgi:hypothetical protein